MAGLQTTCCCIPLIEPPDCTWRLGNTGTGTDDGPCLSVPVAYEVTLAGIIANQCRDCDVYNGTFRLTYQGQGASGFCFWQSDPVFLITGTDPDCFSHLTRLILQILPVAGAPIGLLIGTAADSLMDWRISQEDWDCLGSNVLTNFYAPSNDVDGCNTGNPLLSCCHGWPSTVTLIPAP